MDLSQLTKNRKYTFSLVLIGIAKKLVYLVLIFSSTVLAQKENKYIRSGNDYYEEENFKEAEVDYMKALEKNPESFSGQYNLGGSLYKQENYEDASKLYNSLSARDVDDVEKANALYNLGNTLLQAEKYPESIEAYKNALRLNPDDRDAKYNMEYAKKMLQQQQEQEQNQDQNKDQENKDDQNQDQEKKKQEQNEQDQQQDQQQEKQEQEQQNQQEQNQDQQQNQPSQKQEQPQPQQISQQDAARMLEALENDENKTLEKVRLQQMQQSKAKKVEKDW